MPNTDQRKGLLLVSWICQVVVAGILGLMIWVKFTGAPAVVWIFEELRVGHPGRLISGTVEAL